MENLTPAQRRVIQTWTEERDALLRDIGLYSAELEEKKKANVNAGLAFADLETSIAEVRGRLAEITVLEERMRTSLATDVSELTARKSRLEAECLAKEADSKALDVRKAETVSTIETLVLMHDKMSDQATVVDQVVGQVIETSKNAISEIKTTMADVRTIATEVIDKANVNVGQTNIILEKLPRYIFELQKPIPIRRTFSAPPGTVIEPETPA